MSFFMGTTILAKRFWDQYFPLFTRFCTEFAATGNTHSWIGPNKVSPPSLWTKLRSITCARYVKGVWLATSQHCPWRRGEGSTWIAISSPETESAPNVLTRIVVPAFVLAFCGFICVPYEHLNKFCAHFVSGQFKHFNRSRKRRPCCSDLFSTWKSHSFQSTWTSTSINTCLPSNSYGASSTSPTCPFYSASSRGTSRSARCEWNHVGEPASHAEPVVKCSLIPAVSSVAKCSC